MQSKKGFAFYLRVAGVLLLISTIVAGMLAAVNMITHDRIAENKIKEVNEKISTLFECSVEKTDIPGEYADGITDVWTVTSDGAEIGKCIRLNAKGYGGSIDMMVGFAPDGSILGIQIIDVSSETAGLGSRVAGDAFLSQFTGKTGELSFGDGIDAISGSTVSSRGVLNAVNTARKAYASITGSATTDTDTAEGGREEAAE